MPPDLRDEVVDFVRAFTRRTELAASWVLPWLGLRPAQFYRWLPRYGAVPAHNGRIPREHWRRDA